MRCRRSKIILPDKGAEPDDPLSGPERSYEWEKEARPHQLLPQGDWFVWLLMAGRGFGKTRTGAEAIRFWVKSGTCSRIALVGNTIDEARMVMVEGISGLLEISPPAERPQFLTSKGELFWPSGAKGFLYSSENYQKLRGPQFDGAWIDELAKFRYAQEVWDQLMFALRLGQHPRVIVTTTPRPIPLLEKLVQDPHTHLTTGSSYDNIKNLSPLFINQILKAYEGTKLGAQEIHAELLTECAGALWRRELIQYI